MHQKEPIMKKSIIIAISIVFIVAIISGCAKSSGLSVTADDNAKANQQSVNDDTDISKSKTQNESDAATETSDVSAEISDADTETSDGSAEISDKSAYVSHDSNEEKEGPNYIPTDEEKQLICGSWYRSVEKDDGDKDLYWLTMTDKGYCAFTHETMNTDAPIDKLEGTWSVDEHGYVNIDLGKYSGRFRFLKNSYGSTNIICINGDDFVESGDGGAYASFVPVNWYKGNVRFVEATEAEKAEMEKKIKEAASKASGSDAVEKTPSLTYIEMQGEGDTWYRLVAVEGFCKIDVDTKEGEKLCKVAINQNDHLVVKILQVR